LEKDVGFIRMGRVEEGVKEIRQIGVGVLGYSFMGKAHTNAYIKMPIFVYPPPAKPRLVAIFGRTESAVAEASKRFGYEKYYTDWKGLVEDRDVELVDNGLPNNMHRVPSIVAAEAGKNVLCEKPLARNAKEAREMLRAVEKAGVKHMVGYNYRFVPAIILAKKLIGQGYIGKILHYRAVYLQEWVMDPNFPLVWRLQKDMSGSGAVGDLGAHILDLARFLIGEVSSVCAVTKTFIEERPLTEDPNKKGKVDVDDAFISLLRFRNGAIGSVEASRFCAGRKNYQRLEIHGMEGSIVFNLECLNELEVYSRKDPEETMGFKKILVTETIHPYMKYWWPHGHIIGWEHALVHEVHHFIDCIVNNKEVSPQGATFKDGVKCAEICDAILSSAETEQWVILPQ